MDGPDARLIDAAIANDAEAFDDLMRLHQAAVYRFAYAFTGSREAALDVTQIVFLKAFRNLRRFEKRSSFRTWILRIATNELVNATKADRHRSASVALHAVPDLLDERPDAEREAIARQELAALMSFILALPARERATLVLRHFESCSLEEIARTVGTTVATAKNALYRAHLKLYEFARNPRLEKEADHAREVPCNGV